MTNFQQPSECCPEFHPERWDKKEQSWGNKNFIKESIPTFFHIPYPAMIGKRIAKMWQLAEKAGAVGNKEDVLVLFRDPSAFRSEIYLSVERSVPGANNVTLSGNFISQVFDGGYNAVPQFLKSVDEYLAGMNKKAKDYYIHYAYCPKCVKKFGGHNYMVVFAEV